MPRADKRMIIRIPNCEAPQDHFSLELLFPPPPPIPQRREKDLFDSKTFRFFPSFPNEGSKQYCHS